MDVQELGGRWPRLLGDLYLHHVGDFGDGVYASSQPTLSGKNAKPNRTSRTEPNHLILELAGTGRGTEPNRTGPSHDASEKRRPNRVKPGNSLFRTESNRTDESSKKSGTETNRTEPVPSCSRCLLGWDQSHRKEKQRNYK